MNRHPIHAAMIGLFCGGTLLLAACQQQTPAATQTPAAASSSAPAVAASTPGSENSTAYTPPSADQLYQLVAPIALYPDNLVALVLAGAGYPDQLQAAQQLLHDNARLSPTLLRAAVSPQPWDASIKGLTEFPAALNQLVSNPSWTAALGDAYLHDPTDVLNAIQQMRQRAAHRGNLRSSPQQVVQVLPADAVETTTTTTTTTETIEDGPELIPPPQQIYRIEPAEQDVVYVPSYDPDTVYGEDVGSYPGYTYAAPRYSDAQLATVGAVSFGVGILVGSLLEHDHYDHGPGWGWHSWGVRWAGGPPPGGRPGWSRPVVIHDQQIYAPPPRPMGQPWHRFAGPYGRPQPLPMPSERPAMAGMPPAPQPPPGAAPGHPFPQAGRPPMPVTGFHDRPAAAAAPQLRPIAGLHAAAGQPPAASRFGFAPPQRDEAAPGLRDIGHALPARAGRPTLAKPREQPAHQDLRLQTREMAAPQPHEDHPAQPRPFEPRPPVAAPAMQQVARHVEPPREQPRAMPQPAHFQQPERMMERPPAAAPHHDEGHPPARPAERHDNRRDDHHDDHH